MKNDIYLDLQVGGLGDQWMRLVSLSAVAELCPNLQIHVHAPLQIQSLAAAVFGDRLKFRRSAGPHFRKYVTVGIRHLAYRVVAGERFASPYARLVMHDYGYSRLSIKRFANSTLYKIADAFNFISIPPDESVNLYQGYSEVLVCKEFRHISYVDFVDKIAQQFLPIRGRIVTASASLDRAHSYFKQFGKTIVFPSGTSRTVMPVVWAKKYFSDAWFAFHSTDRLADEFRRLGLNTVTFQTPEDIAYLGTIASQTLSTDSFPSHILQYISENISVLITEASPVRILSPAYRGKIIMAVAPCHPCLKKARSHEFCQAGYRECLNWSDDQYGKDAVLQVTGRNSPLQLSESSAAEDNTAHP